MTIEKGRLTARMDGPFVVFIIGMRINTVWKVHRWLPVLRQMGRMLTELNQRPQMGFLGGKSWLGRTIVLIQYWQSFEALEAYAAAKDSAHLPAWAAFNRASVGNEDVGIYHETYRIEPGQYENIYVNMPPTLLGDVATKLPATGAKANASGRMKG